MAFLKYPAILELKECHGVDVGFAYRTKDSEKIFLLHSRKSTSIFLCSGIFICQVLSFLMDGSTSESKTENELIMIVYCKKDDNAQEMWLCIRFVCMETVKG